MQLSMDLVCTNKVLAHMLTLRFELQELDGILKRHAKMAGTRLPVSTLAASLSMAAQPDVSASGSPTCMDVESTYGQIPWWDLLTHDLGLPLLDQPSRAFDDEQTATATMREPLLQPQGNHPDISHPGMRPLRFGL